MITNKMKSMYKLLLINYGYLVMVVFMVVFPLASKSQAKESVTMLPEGHKHETQNPHWQNNACQACHNIKSTKYNLSRDNLKLHTRDINQLCNSCHTEVSKHRYIHPFGMTPSKKIMANMPSSFSKAVKRGGGELSCITCHDLTMTCKDEEKSKQALNPFFFRDGPYKTRTELCFHCHDKSKYKRLNPHDQIDKNGKLDIKKCTICHNTTEKLTTAKNISEVDFNYEGNLSLMCAGCHPVKPHPGGSFSFFSNKKGPNHLVKPSASILKHKLEMEVKNNIILPLEPGSGKVFCGTCHNPHEKGVIKQAAAAKGADEKKRLRAQKLCTNCHEK